ncbi:hypothetical protein Tco_1017893 [Tanacetum coccineum]|uniref:Uncharacterized protein n=1 Tax=Tanacetum coccineum TaxID=301880 RepID=A0ABQ5FU78_9ASTR
MVIAALGVKTTRIRKLGFAKRQLTAAGTDKSGCILSAKSLNNGFVSTVMASLLAHNAWGDEFRNQHAIAVAAAEYETKVVAILVRNNNGDKVSF